MDSEYSDENENENENENSQSENNLEQLEFGNNVPSINPKMIGPSNNSLINIESSWFKSNQDLIRQVKMVQEQLVMVAESLDLTSTKSSSKEQIKKLDKSARKLSDITALSSKIPSVLLNVADNYKKTFNNVDKDFLSDFLNLDKIDNKLKNDDIINSIMNIYSPEEQFNSQTEKLESDWYNSTSKVQRYGKSNIYKEFKELLWLSRYNGKRVLPPETRWFDSDSDNDLENDNINNSSTNINKNSYTDDQDDDLIIESEFQSLDCPLTATILENPVRSNKCPHYYSKAAITNYINQNSSKRVTCPVSGCNQMLTISCLVPDRVLAKRVQRYLESQKENDSEDEFERV